MLSLDWILNSGIHTVGSIASGILTLPCVNGVFSVQMNLSVVSGLPSDLVLGREWLQYCQESVSPKPVSTCPPTLLIFAALRSHIRVLLRLTMSLRPAPPKWMTLTLSQLIMTQSTLQTVSVMTSLSAVVPPHPLFR
ncbi:hypothetical protein B0H17DRAFT_1146959 [Mycena rosella]|uniref:Uncharacterized protein n=1 Tax=Mycena rosella TaxID=1033263 RepID=A0AAD7CMU2_MYCRO|nr:hypothetical protein B0H17DRAFT_1146959 [Mycena rosella]